MLIARSLWRISRIGTIGLALAASAAVFLAPDASHAGPPPFVVNNSGDAPDSLAGDGLCATDGDVCTLRAAIEEANTDGDTDFIEFNLSSPARLGSAGAPEAITPSTVLPAITMPAFIDGRTQPGYDGHPLIYLDGSLLTEGMGLYVDSNDTTVAGLRISGFPDNDATPLQYGAQIFSSSSVVDNIYTENVLGLAPDGQPTGTDIGIWLNENSRVDVTNSVISGNDLNGVYMSGGIDIDLTGNLIGLDEAGSQAVANDVYGILVLDASDVTIGQNTAAPAGLFASHNVISGNGVDGIQISRATNAVVSGNYIGTDSFGTQDVGNLHHGILVRESPGAVIVGNVVSGNGSAPLDAGVFVFDPAPSVEAPTPSGVDPGGTLTIEDNLIGTNAACNAAIPNENGVVVIDQPNDNRFFWDSVLIDGNTISGNQGAAPAVAAGTVTASGTDMVAGDGIVWGAVMPGGGLTISDNVVGSDCEGDPLGNSGDGAIIGVGAVAVAAAPVGNAGSLRKDLLDIIHNNFSFNLEDCIQIDQFTTDELLDLLLFYGILIFDITADECGENGVELNQNYDEGAEFTEDSGTDVSDLDADGNGDNGMYESLHSTGPTPIDPPNLNLQNSDLSGNAAGGFSGQWENEYILPTRCDVGEAGTGQSPFVLIQNTSIHDNGGPGIAVAPDPEAETRPPRLESTSCGRITPVGLNEGTTIYNNGGPAIDLGADGPTANDALDADSGPNGLTNYPALTSAVGGGSVTIAGVYDGAINTTLTLRFYSNAACENGGEGEFYIGSHDIMTDGEGHASFEVKFAETPPGRFIAATATGPEGTSEFTGACIEGEGIGGIPGDTDCDKDVDSVDGLNVLRDVAGFPASECIEAGNVDCDADRDSIDALFILRDVAALPVNLPKGCPEIGP